ncbi:MAG: malonic semialdehyde reductase [Hyphomicrobiales bacterium]|nr:malonic semialdehyde reductase [Hyphomicrobiales bacterium]MDE2018204.1 malonic semialdehyde reductase [Hyphomicrobiales bacterium]
MPRIDAAALDALFFAARSHNKWTDRDVPDASLRELAETLRWAPTSGNASPLRIVFAKSPEAKARLIPLLSQGNREKTMAAPVAAILGADLRFWRHLPKLAPHRNPASWENAPVDLTTRNAMRDATLQCGYFILAARALGLDCGPMGGFDATAVEREFFAGGEIRANLVCALGHGDPTGLRPRAQRLAFEEFATII